MDVRKRKISDNNDSVTTRNRNSRNRQKSLAGTNLQKPFVTVILASLIIILFLGYYTDRVHPIVDSLARKLGYHHTNVYAVVIDAGSTGSRVLAYTFHRGLLDNRLVLDDELFKQTKPGLSSFVDNPERAAESIQNLLNLASAIIPAEEISKTPLVLRATAGLRLLQPDKAEKLLTAVRAVINNSGYKVSHDAVEIMDGTDEGIFSWFTVNILQGTLRGSTIAALDLGGGSNQVTFVPTSKAIASGDLGNNVLLVSTFKQNISVFTNSYLGLGLMAARHAVLTHQNKKGNKLSSLCINPIVKNKPWTYGNVEYSVSGLPEENPKNPIVDWSKCRALVKSLVLPLLDPKPIGLESHEIAAFSYYFDRATESGLVDPFTGGKITVEALEKTASETCATANTDQPFMCLDLTFISVLLQDGFSLKPKTTITLMKQIDGHEISWALGCAYSLLNN